MPVVVLEYMLDTTGDICLILFSHIIILGPLIGEDLHVARKKKKKRKKKKDLSGKKTII